MDKMTAEDFEAFIFDLMQREAQDDHGAHMVLQAIAHYSHRYVRDNRVIREDMAKYKRFKWLQDWIYNASAQSSMNRRLARARSGIS